MSVAVRVLVIHDAVVGAFTGGGGQGGVGHHGNAGQAKKSVKVDFVGMKE